MNGQMLPELHHHPGAPEHWLLHQEDSAQAQLSTADEEGSPPGEDDGELPNLHHLIHPPIIHHSLFCSHGQKQS